MRAHRVGAPVSTVNLTFSKTSCFVHQACARVGATQHASQSLPSIANCLKPAAFCRVVFLHMCVVIVSKGYLYLRFMSYIVTCRRTPSTNRFAY